MKLPYNKLKALSAVINMIVIVPFVIGLQVNVIPNITTTVLILLNVCALTYNIITIEEPNGEP